MIDVDPDFLGFLKHEEARARQNDLSEERSVALDFYNGEPFGDEEEGRSQIVTRDVAETTDHMVISIMRTMVSGDRVVEFSAREEDDVQAADDATEAIGQQFMAEQDGYQVLHDALKAGLLEKTGIIKSYVEEQPHKRHEMVMPAELLHGLMQQGHLPHEAEPADPANEMGDWNVVHLEPQPPKFRDEAVPNEECLISVDTRDPDTSIYMCHRTAKTLSQLREMGFQDVEELEKGGMEDSVVARARDNHLNTGDDRQGANRKVWLHEEYVLYDLDGDGIAERLCVHRVGSTILDVQPVDEQPFSIWCPIPMQHRLVGQSLFDKVSDIQRTRSVLLRQFMDGTYQSNAPRTLVNEDNMGDNTIDDLLTVRPGGLIRYRGAIEPKPFQTGFSAGDTLNALQVMMDERENRTGITKMNQGLDSDAINKTVGGMQMQAEQNAAMEEYIARNFANMVAKMFAKKYRLMRTHGQPFKVKVDGQFRQVDPRQWPERVNVDVNVGLGSGRKDGKVAYLKEILTGQQAAMMGGLRIVGEQQIYNTMAATAKAMGFKQPSDFVIDPKTLPPPQPQQQQPDPKLVKVQTEAQLKGQALQGKQQVDQGALEMKAQQTAGQLQLEREKAAAQLEMQQNQQDQQAALAVRQQNLQEAIANHRAGLAEEKFEISKFRVGGALNK